MLPVCVYGAVTKWEGRWFRTSLATCNISVSCVLDCIIHCRTLCGQWSWDSCYASLWCRYLRSRWYPVLWQRKAIEKVIPCVFVKLSRNEREGDSKPHLQLFFRFHLIAHCCTSCSHFCRALETPCMHEEDHSRTYDWVWFWSFPKLTQRYRSGFFNVDLNHARRVRRLPQLTF